MRTAIVHNARSTRNRKGLDAVKAANSGHSGMPIGMVDAATVLFGKHLKFDAKNPDWPDRDLARVAARLNGWELRPAATEGYRTAEVTLGGVDTRDLSSRTMESGIPGLFFIGEVGGVLGAVEDPLADEFLFDLQHRLLQFGIEPHVDSDPLFRRAFILAIFRFIVDPQINELVPLVFCQGSTDLFCGVLGKLMQNLTHRRYLFPLPSPEEKT